MSDAQTTSDHNTIRQWAEARGGRPVTVKGTGRDHEAGVLRFDFGEPEEGLEEISWEEFFAKFDESELALLYQDKTKDGSTSRFFKLVRR